MATTTLFEMRFEQTLSNVTKEDFLKIFFENWKPMYDEWMRNEELRFPEIYEEMKASAQKVFDYYYQREVEYVNRKYKRESKKTEYLERQAKRLEHYKHVEYPTKVDEPTHLCFSKPGENGTSLFNIKYLENSIKGWWDEHYNNYYFQEALGYRIVIDKHNRWDLELIWNEETAQKVKEDNDRMAREIMEFYATCRYCGD